LLLQVNKCEKEIDCGTNVSIRSFLEQPNMVYQINFILISGLRSYGKVVYVFSLVPVLGIFVLSSKLLFLTPMRHGLFPHTDWSEFFLNSRSWVAAATEVTLTWNLLGAAAMQV